MKLAFIVFHLLSMSWFIQLLATQTAITQLTGDCGLEATTIDVMPHIQLISSALYIS